MKIPFERTISGAYRFAFTNILSIIGIAWFPFVLIIALIGGVIYAFGPHLVQMFEAMRDTPKANPAQAFEFIGSIVAAEAILLPAFLLLSAMATVGVMRKALGQHPGPVFFFFSLGSQVWRLLGSYLIMFLLMIGLIIALVALGVGLYFALAKAVSEGAAVAATVLFGIFGYLFLIYAIVRTYFFIPAIVVAENHIGIRRSWHLGGGNFWRIVGIFLIMTIPVGIAAQMIQQPVLQFAMGGSLALPPNPGPEDIKHFFSAFLQALKSAGPALVVIQLLYMILLTGLTTGAIAQAYNLVTGGPDIAPPKAPA